MGSPSRLSAAPGRAPAGGEASQRPRTPWSRLPKYRLNLGTSVFGALFDTEAPARVALTRSILRAMRGGAFATYIGVPVLESSQEAPRE